MVLIPTAIDYSQTLTQLQLPVAEFRISNLRLTFLRSAFPLIRVSLKQKAMPRLLACIVLDE